MGRALGAVGQSRMVVRTRRLKSAVRLGRAAHGVCLLLRMGRAAGGIRWWWRNRTLLRVGGIFRRSTLGGAGDGGSEDEARGCA